MDYRNVWAQLDPTLVEESGADEFSKEELDELASWDSQELVASGRTGSMNTQ